MELFRKIVCFVLLFNVVLSNIPKSFVVDEGVDVTQSQQQSSTKVQVESSKKTLNCTVKDSVMKALNVGSVMISVVGKFTSYASAGSILAQLLWPEKTKLFLISGGTVAILEKLGKVLYNYLEQGNEEQVVKQINEIVENSPLVDQVLSDECGPTKIISEV